MLTDLTPRQRSTTTLSQPVSSTRKGHPHRYPKRSLDGRLMLTAKPMIADVQEEKGGMGM